jgi:hypothetical protein
MKRRGHGRLKSRVITSTRRSNTAQATVIDVAKSRATVRLSDRGVILTMLPAYDGVAVGDKVVVDYSGTSPLVKTSI